MKRLVRIFNRAVCLVTGHDWEHSRVNRITRKGGKTCQRYRRRLVWKWQEGYSVWPPYWMRAEGEEGLPATVEETVEQWREQEQEPVAGRETR